jgi:hypothetical protein
VFFLILSKIRQLKSKIRSLAPPSFDDVKIKTVPPAQKPASKPAMSSGQKSSAAAAAIALKPPQFSEDGRDESDDVQVETVPAPVPASKPAISSGQKSSAAAAAIAPKPPQYIRAKFKKIASLDDDSNFFGTPSPEPASKPAIFSGQESSAAATATAPKPPQYIRAKFKKIASLDDDSNFFGTPSLSPPSSLPAANSTPRGKPPVLFQGSFRSSLKRARPAFGNVTNDGLWPPKRRKKMAKDSDANPDVEMSDPVQVNAVASSSSSTSHHSNPSFLLPEDREIFNQVGLRKVMAVIAKNYGFDVDVAMKAFFATKSIEKTKSLLQFAKEVTNSATSALLSKLVNDDEEEIDEMAFSDYSPPSVSRAGQFLRLVKEGRREEAVDRERRRASGAFVARTQTQTRRYDDEDQQRQQSSLPLVPNGSPTLNSPSQEPAVDNIETRNVDNFQPPIVAPHEDIVVQQHHDQPQDDENISLPVDVDIDQHQHRIFFKRISEGHSTLNEDEDDPEVLKLAQEHRDLVMNVMEENADVLRSFEQKNNLDLLRLWSLDWARQKIADM